MATNEESIKNDRMKRVLGGKDFAADTDARVEIDQANGRIIVYDEQGVARVLIGNFD